MYTSNNKIWNCHQFINIYISHSIKVGYIYRIKATYACGSLPYTLCHKTCRSLKLQIADWMKTDRQHNPTALQFTMQSKVEKNYSNCTGESRSRVWEPQGKCGANLHCVSKKVPTFKFSLTLSNLDRFSKTLQCWKAYKICYKTHMTLPISP